jgi:hypothetical protein
MEYAPTAHNEGAEKAINVFGLMPFRESSDSRQFPVVIYKRPFENAQTLVVYERSFEKACISTNIHFIIGLAHYSSRKRLLKSVLVFTPHSNLSVLLRSMLGGLVTTGFF